MRSVFIGHWKKLIKVRINADKLNASQKTIVAFLEKQGRITNKDVQGLLGVKDSRALKILKEMAEIGVLEKQGKLKGSYYILKNED